MLTLNFTLVRDNYRDIPNLVALGKKNNVDRILIQKFSFFPKQGYLTLQDKEDQAVHLPSHPDHIHMLRTLELFKNEPILHTFLDVEGFDDKIENVFSGRKALASLSAIDQLIEDNRFLDIFNFVNDISENKNLNESDIELLKSDLEKSTFNLILSNRQNHALLSKYFIDAINSKFSEHIFHSQEKGEYLKAIKCFIVLSFFNPTPNADVCYSIGTSLKLLSRDDEALIFFNKALESELEDLQLRFNIYMEVGFLYKNQGNLLLASENFYKAYVLNQTKKRNEVSEQLHYIYLELSFKSCEENKAAEALKFLLEAQKYESDDKNLATKTQSSKYNIYFHVGFLYKEQGDLTSSQENFLKAYTFATDVNKNEVNKQLYYIYMDLGFIFRKDNKTIESLILALENFLKAYALATEEKKTEISEQLYYIYLDLGFNLQEKKKIEEALNFFIEAQKHEPEDKKGEALRYQSEISFYSNRENGFLHQTDGRYLQAIKAFNTALLHGPGDTDLYFSLGVCLKRQKNYSEAKNCFQKVLHNNPDNYNTLMECGYIELLEDHGTQALNYFLKAKAIEPERKQGHTGKYIRLSRRKMKPHHLILSYLKSRIIQ